MASTGLHEDLGLYLETEITGLTRGSRMFGYQLPASTGNPSVSSTAPIAAIIPEVGFAPVDRFVPASGGLPAFDRPGIRIRVRSTDGSGGGEPLPEASFALASRIHRELSSYPPNSTVAGGVHGAIGAVEPQSAPYLEERDARGRYVFAFRAIVWATP